MHFPMCLFFVRYRTTEQTTRKLLVAAIAALTFATTSGCALARTSTNATARTTTKKRTNQTAKTTAKPTTLATFRPAPTTPQSTTAPETRPPTTRACGPVRVMPLGDSLTAFPDSYRGPLFRRLTGENRNVDFVGSSNWPPTGGGDPDGEGHGGFTIGPDASLDFQGKPSNITANIDAWIRKGDPELILLTIGNNDLAAGGDKAAQAGPRLTKLVARIQATAPDAVIVVGDIPPGQYVTSTTGPSKGIVDAARQLGEASSTDGLLYAPTFRRMIDAGFNAATDTQDGTHFTAGGGEKFADAWYPSVIEALTLLGATC